MSDAEIEIRPFRPAEAQQADFIAWNAFGNCMHLEGWPDDPPNTLEETIRNLTIETPSFTAFRWAAWSDGGIVGRSSLHVWRAGDNQHACGFDVAVRPEGRRRGLGKRLLKPLVETAAQEDRRLLLGGTLARVPCGEAFMRRVGARAGLEGHVNQLLISELDPDLMRSWRERGPSADFELGWWIGPYPEEALADVVEMKKADNLMPRGDLELEDDTPTPELIREWDETMVKRKQERWTVYARDRASGEIAGYTEVYWGPERLDQMWQGGTAVFRKFQNRGLGRWLKATMMEKILTDRPGVKRIRTGNADSNAPMLKINVEMGFKPYLSHTEWQVERETVEAYLNGAA
jgi:mycothiol synthase